MPAKPPRRAGTAPLDSRRANSRPGSRPADDDRSTIVGEPSRHGAGNRGRGNNSNARGAGVPVTKPETREPILVAVRGFEVAIPVGPAPMVYAEEARDPGTLLLAERALEVVLLLGLCSGRVSVDGSLGGLGGDLQGRDGECANSYARQDAQVASFHEFLLFFWDTP